MNQTIYTAIFGDYDDLKEPLVVDENFDYICFTDNKNIKSKVWDIRIVKQNELGPVKSAREIKILAHKFLPEYHIWVWVDANVIINQPLYNYVKENLKGHDIALVEHGRDCIYREAIACIQRSKDSEELIKKQMKGYLAEGVPERIGMVGTTVMIRRNNTRVTEFMELWWEEVKLKSRRDQLSFNYINWKNPLKIKYLPFLDLKGNPFYWGLHKNKYVGRIRRRSRIVELERRRIQKRR